MTDRPHTFEFLPAVIVLFGALAGLHSAFAQQALGPDLSEILLRLESNLHVYDTQIPNFFCNEHVVSKIIYGQKHQSTVTDSVFRLEHVLHPGQGPSFVESREIKAINGSPAAGSNLDGPVVLSGVFSGGLNTVSLSQKACMRYDLQPINPGHSDEAYVVQFATRSDRPRRGCVLEEDGSGRVFIDRATMQVTRMELTVPLHKTVSGPVVRNISVDYAPVLLAAKTFWMPKTIVSTATPTDDYDPAVLSFAARYSDYHKLEVTSRILPSIDPARP
jgi:hypothetical protein